MSPAASLTLPCATDGPAGRQGSTAQPDGARSPPAKAGHIAMNAARAAGVKRPRIGNLAN